MKLRLVTLNIKCCHRLDNQIEVDQLARSVRCDLLFIQQVRFSSRRVVEEFKALFRVEAFFSFATRRGTGVAIMVFNRTLPQSFSFFPDPNRQVPCFDFLIGVIHLRCVSVYASTEHGLNSSFYRGVALHLLFWGLIILLGDFNCVLAGKRDVRGPVQADPYETRVNCAWSFWVGGRLNALAWDGLPRNIES